MVCLSGAARRSDPGSFRACFAHLLFREDYTSSSDRVDKYGSIAAILSGEALEPLGIKPEGRDFSPHLTLARGKSAAPQRRPDDHPNRSFQQLQEKLSALPSPEFGTMSAREFFLYQSKLSPAGSQYTKLQKFPLT